MPAFWPGKNSARRAAHRASGFPPRISRPRGHAQPMTDPAADPRLAMLSEWLASALQSREFTLAPASEDARFRRYFRVTPGVPISFVDGAATLIAMDAPPPPEDFRAL